MTNSVKMIVVAVGIVLLSAVGYLGTACASALYADHQLLNQIRANSDAQIQQAAAQVQQFKQQQAAQAAPVAPAAPVPPAK